MSEAPVACAGAPRDLGLDQGAATGAAVRAAVARLPWAARLAVRAGADRRVARCASDSLCHYPHASERLAGLARSAGVSRGALAALLARELAAGTEPPAAGGEAFVVRIPPEAPAALAEARIPLARPAAAAAVRGSLDAPAAPGRLVLVRTLVAPPGAGPAPWIVRRSAPEHDWRSVELALPWLVPALAGVNERGLAVAGVVRPASPGSLDRCAAPALLLVQECLQRCDSVRKAVEWCERRPTGGSAAILLVDATGDAAQVVLEGPHRTVERPLPAPCPDRPTVLLDPTPRTLTTPWLHAEC